LRELGEGYEIVTDIENKHNFQYFGTLFVGSHLQELTFIFDTGSAWTWIPSEDCPDEECPNRHYQYHLSSGYQDTGETDNVVYGIGEIKGQIVNDDIAITRST
jgi:hypothetical protein